MARRGLPVDELVAPLPLVAMAVLAVNDHWLKRSGVAPGWLTGKLSDLAGLFFFPLLVSAVIGAVTGRPATRRRLAILCGLTAAGFSLLKLSPAFAGFYVWLHETALAGQFAVAPDPTDLLALPMVALAWAYGGRRIARAEGRRTSCVPAGNGGEG